MPTLRASLAALPLAAARLLARPAVLLAVATAPAAPALGEGAGGVWAYLGLLVGPIATEELTPLLAGVAIAEGKLAVVPAMLAMAIGGWVATALIYALGRWRGRWVRRRFPKADRAIKGLLRATRRRPWRASVLVRWAFGLRILLPLACGAAHVRPDVYLIGSAISSITWTVGYTLVGYFFGQAAIAVLQRLKEYDHILTGVAAGFAVVAFLVWRRRQQRALAERAARAAHATPPLPEPPA